MAKISKKEAHAVAGELGRRAKLYTELEEVIGIALQAEDDMETVQKETGRLKVEREKVKAEYEKYVAGVKDEKKRIQLDLDDLKAMVERTKREAADSSDKDAKINSDKAASLRKEVNGLVKQRDDIFAELPIVRTEVDAEIRKCRTLGEREKKKLDDELSDSQNKLRAFKSSIAGVHD